MSKSDPSDMSRINLTDSDDDIAQKVRKAKTDPEPLPDNAAALQGRPEAQNLVGIYGAITGETVDDVLARFAGQGFGAFKPALADALVALIAPIRARLEELRKSRKNSTGSSPTAPPGRTRLPGPFLPRPNQPSASHNNGEPTVNPDPRPRNRAHFPFAAPHPHRRRGGTRSSDLLRSCGAASSSAWGGLLFIFAAINAIPLPPGAILLRPPADDCFRADGLRP